MPLTGARRYIDPRVDETGVAVKVKMVPVTFLNTT
jgi:hypothetical protein